MSPLWRERTLVSLAPRQVAGVRVANLPRTRVAARELRAVDAADGGNRWDGAVAALDQLFAGMPAAKTAVTVVLSNHFVRYAMVPWSAEITRQRDELALARHYFSRIYGADTVSRWELRVADGPAGAPRVASAVDRELLQAIRERCALARTRLVSVQPYLMAAFNLWRRSFKDGESWFAAAEDGGVCIATLRRGAWQSVRWERLTHDSYAELDGVLERHWRLAALEERPRLYLHLPQRPRHAVAANPAWPTTPLVMRPQPGFSPYDDAQYAMAMSAAG